MIETAIALPLLVLIALGVVEFGFAYSAGSGVGLSTRTAVRTMASDPQPVAGVDVGMEGAVLGAQEALRNLRNTQPLELYVYEANPTTGMPSGGSLTPAGCGTNCVRYEWSGPVETGGFGAGIGSWPPANRNNCAGATDYVGVGVVVRYDFFTSFFGLNRIITDHTVMRLEPAPFDQCV